MTLAIVLLVAGLLVGGGIGWYMKPKETVTGPAPPPVNVPTIPLQGVTVKLGYIASTTTGLETAKPYRDQIITVDMNAYAKQLGYNVAFAWNIDDAQAQANIHLEKVQALKAMSITVFEGGGYSSMAAAALNYCNTNKMLMWSTSSTSPTLAIANDYLYRLCPADSYLAPALAKMIYSYGCKYVVFVQRGDSWGDGIKNLFEESFGKLGGSIYGEIIRYAGESTEFANYLATADKEIEDARAKYGKDKVGGVLLAFDESVTILTQAKDYPNVYSTAWFGADGTAKLQRIVDDAGIHGVAMKVYSLLAAASETPAYTELDARYKALNKQPISSYTAYQYDVGFIVESAMLEKQSQKAEDILPLMAPICYRFFGTGGWSRLNEFGDRVPPPFDIWGYGIDPATNKPNYIRFGGYDIDTQIVVWDTTVLGFEPKPAA